MCMTTLSERGADWFWACLKLAECGFMGKWLRFRTLPINMLLSSCVTFHFYLDRIFFFSLSLHTCVKVRLVCLELYMCGWLMSQIWRKGRVLHVECVAKPDPFYSYRKYMHAVPLPYSEFSFPQSTNINIRISTLPKKQNKTSKQTKA